MWVREGGAPCSRVSSPFKAEWVKSVATSPMTLEVGNKAQFPALLRTFERGVHKAIVLDDVRDLAFPSENRESLHATYNAIIEFGTTPSGEYAYHHYLFQAPIAVTVNLDAKSREWLESRKHDCLGSERNRVVVYMKEVRCGASSASSSSAAACASFCGRVRGEGSWAWKEGASRPAGSVGGHAGGLGGAPRA